MATEVFKIFKRSMIGSWFTLTTKHVNLIRESFNNFEDMNSTYNRIKSSANQSKDKELKSTHNMNIKDNYDDKNIKDYNSNADNYTSIISNPSLRIG